MRFKVLFVGLSLLLGSCGSGPKVTICIVDSVNGGMQCVDPQDRAFFLSLQEAENYVALPPNDMRTLIEYCGLSKKELRAVNARAAFVEAKAKEHANAMAD